MEMNDHTTLLYYSEISYTANMMILYDIDGLVQDCSNSISHTPLQWLQPCVNSSMYVQRIPPKV